MVKFRNARKFSRFGLEARFDLEKHRRMTGKEKRESYRKALDKAEAMLDGESDQIAAMATIASLLAGEFPYFYWTGFYRLIDGQLVIGPYQGTPGCLRIALDRGVCGASASSGETVIVQDVHDFPGHIACDPVSKSEIVVPVRNSTGKLLAVLDVDSAEFAAFDDLDRDGLEKIVHLLTAIM